MHGGNSEKPVSGYKNSSTSKNNAEVIWSRATPWRFRFQDIIRDLDDLLYIFEEETCTVVGDPSFRLFTPSIEFDAEGNTLPRKTLRFSQIQKRDRNLIMASRLLLRRVPMGIFLALLMPRRSGQGPG